MEEQLSFERERERGSRKRKFKQHYDELKLEKSEEERIDEDENPRKVCRICKKEFESGKALGGHMRVHAQEPSSQRSINGDGDGFICSSDGPFCNLCRRAFHSWKSLYGHMRCHPGRQSDGSAHNFRSRRGVDLISHVTGWAITGKRGRGSSLPAPEMDIMEAAQNLLWLSTGPGLWDEKISECTAGERGYCYGETGVRIESESCFILLDDSNSEQKKRGNANAAEKKKRGRKKKVQVQVDTRPVYPVVVPGAGGEFECVTCSKKFSTYQALGGHRSKHYRDREGNGVGVGSCFFQPGPGPGPGPQNGSGNSAESLAGQVWGLWEAAQLAVDVNQPANCI